MSHNSNANQQALKAKEQQLKANQQELQATERFNANQQELQAKEQQLMAKQQRLNAMFNELQNECQNTIRQALFNDIRDYMAQSQSKILDAVHQSLTKAHSGDNVLKSDLLIHQFNASRDILIHQFKQQNEKYLQSKKAETDKLYAELQLKLAQFNANDVKQ